MQNVTEQSYLWDRVVGQVVSGGFPLIYQDEARQLAVIVLNTVSDRSGAIGSSAIGSIDSGQLEQLPKAIERALPDSKAVVVLMHHAPFRDKSTKFVGPEDPRSLRSWEDSVWWAYSLLRLDAARGHRLVEIVQEAAHRNPSTAFFIAYGHRHDTSLGRYGVEGGQVWAMETGNLADRQFHAVSVLPSPAVATCGF